VSKPNSVTTRIRQRIVKVVEPYPDPGEAWCIRCSLNERRTLIISVHGVPEHLLKHVDADDQGIVKILKAWRPEKR
jgi:hypothetical protein